MAPRLRICSVGPLRTSRFAARLERVGHHLFELAEPHDIERADLVLLDSADPDWVRERVSALVPYVRRRQMFVHTCLGEGVQLLDDAELEGAVVMAAHNFFGDAWVTSAADEVGETVIGLLLSEIGGMSFPIEDAKRPALLAALRLREQEAVLRRAAFDMLGEVLPDTEVLAADFLPEAEPAALPVAQLERAWAAIGEPSVARLFADAERRQAECSGHLEAELWAISKQDMGRQG